ncbi:MAG: uracil-DNA glycosylase, partial [Gammaproteobacteria bacterium]
MSMGRIKLESSWLAQLADEFEKPYMKQLRRFLQSERAQGKAVYPAGGDMFAALNHTAFEATKIVILGQDPYHGPGQAHGLSFSVKPGVPVPPSLQNIFKELQTDVGVTNGAHGCLTSWADQGVLLLNSVLSVVKGQAASHQGQGWETFTDAIIEKLNVGRDGLVFM